MTVSRNQRYTKRSRCPICDGAEQDPREQSRRCIGYLSTDGDWARCSREEYAGALNLEESSGCYVHKLRGECRCGQVHGEAVTRTQDVIEAVYDYKDERGELLYQVVRKLGKRFQQRRPDPAGRDGWTWKTAGVRRVLYRLPELLAAGRDETVVIVEGEKDVETLVRRGIVATTNAQGSGKWSSVADQARTVLLGRNVVIIADADDAGRKHAKQVALSLTGIAATLEVLEPTKGKDVTDHINAGGTYDDLIPLASGVVSTPDEEKKEDKPQPLPEPLAPNTGQAYKFRIGDHVEIAERLLVLLQNDTRVAITGDEQEIYGYNPVRGLYSQIIKEDQSRIVQTLSGSVVKGKDKPLGIRSVDISGAQRCAYDRVSQPGFFSDAPPGLAFLNGFVTVSENGPTLKAHSPDNRARFGYAFNYDASVSAPMWLTFLGEIFRDDDDRAEKILCLQEHLGASLLGVATTFQKCIVCIGEGDEGKSTFTQIISSAFPPGSIEAIPPQEWGQEYRRAMLAGKLLNTVAELPESDIISSESFKAVIAGDPITGRHIRQAPFTFKPRAGHLFLANRLPGTPDQTRGFWRRFVVIRFNRSFTGDAARDPRIAEKIIAAERSSLVSWALQGAVRLMQQRGHTVPMSHEKELAVWRRNADQIAAFMEDKVVIEPGFGTQASKAYAAYRDWAQANGHFSVSSSKFSARLRELGYPAKKTNVANIYPIVVSGCPREVVEAPGSAVGAAGSKLSPKDPNTYN